MINKIYTYDDWLNGKVVLVYSRLEYNRKEISEPIIVSWDNFKLIDRNNIQKQQEVIFNELLSEQNEITRKDFEFKVKESNFPDILISKEIKSLTALLNDRYICKGGICFSPVKNDNRTFSEAYYQEMIMFYENFLINGLSGRFDSVPSPHSIYNNKTIILPEVMISNVLKMITFIKKFKVTNNNNSELDENQEDTNEENLFFDNLTMSDGYNPRVFNNSDSYLFFLKCKEAIKTRNYNKVKATDMSKYSLIFFFMKRKLMLNSQLSHIAYMEYLKKNHNAIFSSKINKLIFQPSESGKDMINELYENHIKSLHK